jgi:hypothetical protein
MTPLLTNIERCKNMAKRLDEIRQELSRLHKSPLTLRWQFAFIFLCNFFWAGLFVYMGSLTPFSLIAAPVVFYYFKGSTLSLRLEAVLMKRKLSKNEQLINSLLRDRNEYVKEWKELSHLSERFLTRDALDRFEQFAKEDKAYSFEECAALYEKDAI